jgi:hypothetical protein
MRSLCGTLPHVIHWGSMAGSSLLNWRSSRKNIQSYYPAIPVSTQGIASATGVSGRKGSDVWCLQNDFLGASPAETMYAWVSLSVAPGRGSHDSESPVSDLWSRTRGASAKGRTLGFLPGGKKEATRESWKGEIEVWRGTAASMVSAGTGTGKRSFALGFYSLRRTTLGS